MSLLCWNYPGLGNPQTIQELGDLVRAQDLAVVFLAETWLDEARLIELQNKMGFGDTFGVSRVTRGGGLALFWKKDVELLVENSSLNYIDAIINKGKENSWRFTSFYGFPKTQNHMESWNKIRWLHQKSSLL